MAFLDMGVSGLVEKIRRKEIGCLETVKSSLDLIREKDDSLHSFISVQEEEALARAKTLDSLPDEQKEKMPLLGVPLAVKDNICTEGTATTCGSKMLQDFKPPYNAAVVEMLLEAGAVIVGKANLDEFAMGSSTETSFFGVTRNPVDQERIPGGSSGGSAAAVGAGLVPAALGSDTGGSIRQPCSHCGVAGLKPTYGRVSRYGLVAFASSLDQIGPIASDVRDLGLLLSVISGADKRDSTCAGKPFADSASLYSGDIRGLRIGLPAEYFGEGLTDEVRKPILETVGRLKDSGAVVEDVSLPNVSFAIATYYIICTAEASSNLARYDGVKYGFRSGGSSNLMDMYSETRKQGFGEEVKRRIMLGTYVLSSGYYDAYYLKAARVRTLIKEDFERAFQKCDILISPVTPAPAFKLGEKLHDPLQMYLTDIYTVSANLAGIPALSVPCPFAEGLPVGVQFMAPHWREDTALRMAFAVQAMKGN
ncbi:MAG TPA: Asp-tRNA(Asn)/Glu-tRNA(Gln) amidotransferase subunit GatA [Chitinispirillaceae bacterium]|jgi:aspartyl-tRNA(Asn)/glutamyl-tRNA(Gln) amidotransferase subunit A|nr:Asp-tRNA(Asn)/Glu-tRNA(Gln) amidotransferase subunit GatA [Chitinispirillaceae bacterium]